jgi:integrase
MAHHKFRTTFTFDGKRHEVGAGSEEALAAAKAAKLRQLEMGQDLVAGRMPVSDWATQYIDTCRKDFVSREYATNLRSLAKVMNGHIGGLRVQDVRKAHCMSVVSGMVSDGYSQEYISKVKGFMSSMFEEAADNGMIERNPARNLKQRGGAKGAPKKQRRPLTDAEREAMLACGERLGGAVDAYIRLMLFFGLRPSEAARVQGVHFDTKLQKLHVMGTKSARAERDVPIPGHLLEWAQGMQSLGFGYAMGQPHSKSSLHRLWDHQIRRGIDIAKGCRVYRNQVLEPRWLPKEVTAYYLRHTYASDLIGKGVPKDVVSLLLGHEDTGITDNYIRMTDAAFASVLEKI